MSKIGFEGHFSGKILDSSGNPVRTALESSYGVVMCDPPWMYYGSKTKDAAAGKHYDQMGDEDLKALPVRELLADKGALFLWATCPRLDAAIEMIKAWGLHYRGVAWVWVKCRKDGQPIHGQGVPPTFTKPTTELVLAATTMKRGRPWKLLDSAAPQVVFEPRLRHSEKPKRFHRLVEGLCGSDVEKVELFCRGLPEPGWHGWGLECGQKK